METAEIHRMSAQEIIEQLPKLSAQERETILHELMSLDAGFDPSPAMEEAIREGLRSLQEEKTYSARELRSRIDAWTTQ